MRVTFLAISLLMAGAVRPAFASDTPADDLEAYQQKLGHCTNQMASEHPEMSVKQRRKACKRQLGPAPKGVVPAKAPAPVF